MILNLFHEISTSYLFYAHELYHIINILQNNTNPYVLIITLTVLSNNLKFCWQVRTLVVEIHFLGLVQTSIGIFLKIAGKKL